MLDAGRTPPEGARDGVSPHITANRAHCRASEGQCPGVRRSDTWCE